MTATRAPLRGTDILEAIKASGVEFVVSVPDIVTSDGLLWPLSKDGELRLIRVCKEDEGIGICAGLSFCDRRALLLIQQTGLLDAMNAVRAVAVEYALPICMMVGLQGKEPELAPAASAKYGVRIVEPLLDVMGIRHRLIQSPRDVESIRPAIDAAYTMSHPTVMLIGRTLE